MNLPRLQTLGAEVDQPGCSKEYGLVEVADVEGGGLIGSTMPRVPSLLHTCSVPL